MSDHLITRPDTLHDDTVLHPERMNHRAEDARPYDESVHSLITYHYAHVRGILSHIRLFLRLTQAFRNQLPEVLNVLHDESSSRTNEILRTQS